MTIETEADKLSENLKKVIEAAESCPSSFLNKKQGEQWSILEILEHIFLTDKSVHFLLLKTSDRMHSTEEIFGKEKLKKMLVDQRSYKIKAPAYLMPQGIFKNIDAFVSAFSDERNALIHDIRSGKIKVDNHIYKHPVLGDMTIADWINFLIQHTNRHLEQVRDNLKSNEELSI